MTHRDGFPRLSARSAWCGDAGHRKPRGTPSESLGYPPFRSRGRTAGGRRKALKMSRIACGFPPTRRIARAISMGHYQGPLVFMEARRAGYLKIGSSPAPTSAFVRAAIHAVLNASLSSGGLAAVNTDQASAIAP